MRIVRIINTVSNDELVRQMAYTEMRRRPNTVTNENIRNSLKPHLDERFGNAAQVSVTVPHPNPAREQSFTAF
jgi:hypothetical protein